MSQDSESQSGSTIPPRHTPGPWEWRETPWSGAKRYLVAANVPQDVTLGLDYRPIVDADPSAGEYNFAIEVPSPDATLITAAPDGYDLAVAVMDILEPTDPYTAELRRMAARLIAKAEGRGAE